MRCASLDTVLKIYNVLCEEFTQIGVDSSGESSTKALGLLALLEKFSTYFGLKFAHSLFGASEQLSLTIQYKDLNVQEASLTVRQLYLS